MMFYGSAVNLELRQQTNSRCTRRLCMGSRPQAGMSCSMLAMNYTSDVEVHDGLLDM